MPSASRREFLKISGLAFVSIITDTRGHEDCSVL
jgi:hypothetical protein